MANGRVEVITSAARPGSDVVAEPLRYGYENDALARPRTDQVVN
jgi:hypothetical protein